jgi:hypothetical protein
MLKHLGHTRCAEMSVRPTINELTHHIFARSEASIKNSNPSTLETPTLSKLNISADPALLKARANLGSKNPMGCECVLFKLFKIMGSGESWDSEPPCAQLTASSIYTSTSIPYTSCDGRGSMLGVTKNKLFFYIYLFIYYQ